MRFLSLNIEKFCKCNVLKIIGMIIATLNKIERLKFTTSEINKMMKDIIKLTELKLEDMRDQIRNKPECDHSVNEISRFFREILARKSDNPEKLTEYCIKQRNKIVRNIVKLSVAPGEKGKWMNWLEDIFLEEKLFPDLFPYGIGGYLSSNMLKNSNMGFSNYIKSRLLSVNPKFRNDPFYIFFLLLVKEMVDMKRSERTVLRKATKVPTLNAKKVIESTHEFLKRYNNAFSTFKTIRGTAMYYQDVKKKLNAFIRQNGAPTLFCTFSSAEFDWDELALQIYQTKTRKKVTIEFIKAQSQAWKNKLLSENVVQSTLHFSKRTDKIMNLLQNMEFFEHNGVTYFCDSFFYRVEFQARGAPHIHCMIWLRGENGEVPPTLYSENETQEQRLKSIADFGKSMISSSSRDVNCDDHTEFNDDCSGCEKLKHDVEHYQVTLC